MLQLSYDARGQRWQEQASGLVLTARGTVAIEAAGRRLQRLGWSAVEQMISSNTDAEARNVEITSEEPFTLYGPDGHRYETVDKGYRLAIVDSQLCLVVKNDDSDSARFTHYLATADRQLK